MKFQDVSIEPHQAPPAVRGKLISEAELLAGLGLAGVLARGAHITWLQMVDTGGGQICNDALIRWDVDSGISAAVVDRSSGEPEVVVGFEAELLDDGNFRLRTNDLAGEDVLQRFREAVAGMELATDDEPRLAG